MLSRSRRRIDGAERGHRWAPAPHGFGKPGMTRPRWPLPSTGSHSSCRTFLAAGGSLHLSDTQRRLYLRPDFNRLDHFCPAEFPANRLSCGARPNRPRRVIDVFLQVEGVFAKRYEPRIEAHIALGSPDESFWPTEPATSRGGGGGLRHLASQTNNFPNGLFVNSELAEKICRLSPVVRRCWTSGRYRQRSTRAGYMPVRVLGR